jgi:putative N6-adenine-specific DNA methylase
MGENVNELYKSIGDVFKKKYAGYDCWMITSNMEAVKHIGLKPTRKITVFNGPLECRFLKFSIYAGTKKVHKVEKLRKSEGLEGSEKTPE